MQVELPVFYAQNCKGWKGAVPVALLAPLKRAWEKKDLQRSAPCPVLKALLNADLSSGSSAL